MNTEPEIVKTFNYVLCGSDRFSPAEDIELPVNRKRSEYLDRVNEALQKRKVMAVVESIELYKVLEPLQIGADQTDEWRPKISNPQSYPKHFKHIPHRSLLASFFPEEDPLDDDIVHLGVVFLWKEVAFNYLLFDRNYSWNVRSIQLPVNRMPQDCLERVAEALQKWNFIADVGSIQLYKPLEPLLNSTTKTDEWRATISSPDADFQYLSPSSTLYESFSLSELHNRNILHLIITAQPSQPTGTSSEETDDIAPLREFYGIGFRDFRKAYTSANAKTPSTATKSSEFRKIQRTKVPIYDGRRAPGPTNNSSTIAMPPSLYHPVFEIWKNNAFDSSIEPPPEIVKAAAELMRKVTVLYEDEGQRSKALRGPLQRLLGQQTSSLLNADKTVADGCITFQLQREAMTYNIPTVIIEEKREAVEGTDATTQATFSMIRVWTDPRLDDSCNLTCCPTFLLGFSGCQLTISAAVLTDKCIVERLATLWVGRSSTFDQNRIVDTARVFHALSMALEELVQWYQSDIIANRDSYDPAANKPFNHPRFFPHADQYPANGEGFDDAIKFEYLYPLETSSLCVTFLARATTDHSDKFVVKFTQQYCSALHRLLAERGMAPALRYCGRIDASTPYQKWQMVVMDYYDGRPPTEEQAPEIRDDIKKTVTIGHEAGFVFGDIRRPNVLVGKADGQVKLIDFDWAGKADEARYPPDMSDNDMLWVAGMKPTEIIQKQHDLDMIDKWFLK
ncbi:hypothetical protein D9619_010368 [Psilocybe cf. subviscida]|uniref:Protein kinase domain-containing protein n=1 Tax=Psilocybe cf. subviscida TaxID=2480587 RepID=A0A8H5ERQ0_9AGAR|nr:hypothetical protein D9619_010368 [Psilocybe cf. subviscida]